MNTSFRQRALIRSFAFGFAASCALAGCASDGSVKPSTQSQLVAACDKAQAAVTVAGFFEEKMTPQELKVYRTATDSTDQLCSPSALAAYATPAAQAAAIGALGNIVRDMDTVKDAAPVANVGNRT